MKISKLFHWLYALLMLMPVFFIGFTCCYVVFNDNAFESYYGETINEERYEVLTNINQFQQNKTYYFTTTTFNNNGDTSKGAYARTLEFISPNVITNNTNFNDFENYTKFAIYITNNGELSLRFYVDNTTYTTQTMSTTQSLTFTFTYISDDFLINFAQYNIFEEIVYNKYSYLDDVFEYSLDKLEDSPYFSWAYDSFLVSPFRYIGNLFSVPSNSVIYLFLSYWLDISIIYLVFDMVMYVPLLVHRWLDKGVLE